MTSDISYIIGFRAANSERVDALLFVLWKLRNDFPSLEIQVIEQDAEPKLQLDSSLNIKHFFVYNPGLYNRCWAFNVGVACTSKNVFAFADSDIFLSKENYLSCFEGMKQFEALTPNKVEAVNVAIDDQTLLTYRTIDYRQLYTFAGGILFLTRESFLKLGGWDERFKGWGGEDEALSHVIYNTLTSKTFYFSMYHIDHPRSNLDGSQQSNYKENRKLVEEILAMNEAPLVRYVQSMKSLNKGDINKYATPSVKKSEQKDKVKKLNFVLAVTTFNRLKYLEGCINSFLQTTDQSISWQLLIADDGSTDGTKAYLKKLETQFDVKVLHNDHVGVHHQVNTILGYLSTLEFDLCFKCDDDILFLDNGWELLYWKTIQRTGYDHLVFYDKNWQPHANLQRPVAQGDLVAHCLREQIQGGFYTLTKEVIQKVGYFDTQRFGRSGLGHIDYSFRCCRAGFNDIRHPLDVVNSNTYIQLQSAQKYVPSISSKSKSFFNSKAIQEYKKKIMQTNRKYIPYNENIRNVNRSLEQPIIAGRKPTKGYTISPYKKADATFYPERGISGFVGFLLKRFYNISISAKLYFIPRSLKMLGKVLNKLSIDLLNISD